MEIRLRQTGSVMVETVGLQEGKARPELPASESSKEPACPEEYGRA